MGARAYDLPPITTRARRPSFNLSLRPQVQDFTPPVPVMSPLPMPGMPQPAQPPEGMSLFSDEDMRGARARGLMGFGLSLLGDSGWHPKYGGPTLTSSIGKAGAAGLDAFDSAKANALATRAQGMQLRDAERLSKSRAAIMQKYPISPNMTSEQTISTLERMFAEFSAAGDHEMSGKIGEVLKSYGGNRAGAKVPQWEDFGGYKQRTNPLTGEPMGDPVTKTPSPRDPNAPSGAEQLREQRMIARANALQSAWTRETNRIAQAAEQFGTLMSNVDEAKTGNPMAQIALVFAYMKTLDPTSVVRETEYATVENARGIPEHVRNLWNRVKDGARLTSEQIDNMTVSGRNTAKTWKRKQNSFAKTYAARAKRRGVDPEDVVFDFFDGMGLDDDNSGPRPTGTRPPGSAAEPFFNF